MIRKIAVRPCTDDKCPICLDELKKSKFVCQLPFCKHQFHFNCYRNWEQKSPTCPVCRRTYFFESYHYPMRYKSSRIFANEKYNRRYWPTLYNRVLCELRQYIRSCRYENVSMREFNANILKTCRIRIRNQDNAWYYDKDIYYNEKGQYLGLLGKKYPRGIIHH